LSRGVQVGDNARFLLKIVTISMNIRPFRNISPQLGARVFVDASAVVIGRVKLGDDVSVWPTVVIRGDVNEVTIGARSNVQDGSVLHVTSPNPQLPSGIPMIVGEGVTIGHGCVLHGCTIGNFCLIGMGAIVLDGAVLDDYVFVGAGAVVTPGKRLASGMYVGSPARRVRDLTAAEIANLHESAAHYVEVKADYM
jgi:carbonic anhydrase/acetyltransferase-like protein (isoleucine patch superfamily)